LTVVGLLPSGNDRPPDWREAVIERGEGPSHAAAATVGSDMYRTGRLYSIPRSKPHCTSVCLRLQLLLMLLYGDSVAHDDDD